MARVLNGPFLAYTNTRGECHLNRAGLREPFHTIALTSALSPLPLASFRAGDGPSWRPFSVAALPAGYVQVWNDVRWYRVALGPDPHLPGALLVSCRYIVFAGPHTLRTLPAPNQFWNATDSYVRQLAAYLTP